MACLKLAAFLGFLSLSICSVVFAGKPAQASPPKPEVDEDKEGGNAGGGTSGGNGQKKGVEKPISTGGRSTKFCVLTKTSESCLRSRAIPIGLDHV